MQRRSLPLADFRIPQETLTDFKAILKTNRLTYGPYTERFERAFAKQTQTTYATFVNSGTSALQLAVAALKQIHGWRDGDEILVPAITFIASSNAVIHNAMTPIFVDVEPDYYCLDPDEIERHLTRRTRAIMPVHLFGQSADMNAINAIAKKYNLAVIEDAAEALFSTYHGKSVGSVSDVSIFSTYAAHTLTTGVGGFTCTNDEDIARLIQSLSYHGRDRVYYSIDDDDHITNPVHALSVIERRFHFPYLGYSFRLTELEAAIGLRQLAQRDQLLRQRTRVEERLRNILTKYPALELPAIRPDTQPVFMLFPIVLRDAQIDLDDLLLHLEQHGVETRLFFPLLTQPVYKKRFGDLIQYYPVAKRLTTRGFMIGCHPNITQQDLQYLSYVLSTFFDAQQK